MGTRSPTSRISHGQILFPRSDHRNDGNKWDQRDGGGRAGHRGKQRRGPESAAFARRRHHKPKLHQCARSWFTQATMPTMWPMSLLTARPGAVRAICTKSATYSTAARRQRSFGASPSTRFRQLRSTIRYRIEYFLRTATAASIMSTDTGPSPSVVYGAILARGDTSENPVIVDSTQSNGLRFLQLQRKQCHGRASPHKHGQLCLCTCGHRQARLTRGRTGRTLTTPGTPEWGHPSCTSPERGRERFRPFTASGFNGSGVMNSSAERDHGGFDNRHGGLVAGYGVLQCHARRRIIFSWGSRTIAWRRQRWNCRLRDEPGHHRGFPTVNAGSTALAAAGGTSGIIVDNDSSIPEGFQHLLRDQDRGDPGQSHAVRAELRRALGGCPRGLTRRPVHRAGLACDTRDTHYCEVRRLGWRAFVFEWSPLTIPHIGTKPDRNPGFAPSPRRAKSTTTDRGPAR